MFFTPVDILRKTKDNNITVDEVDMNYCMGCIGLCWDRYRIVIDIKMHEVDKRMTTAHELWHFLTDTVNYWNPTHEGMANKKARELLIPCSCLEELIKDDHTDYSTLASLFGVSEKMIQLRCRDLSIF